jgi:hypothetical protein
MSGLFSTIGSLVSKAVSPEKALLSGATHAIGSTISDAFGFNSAAAAETAAAQKQADATTAAAAQEAQVESAASANQVSQTQQNQSAATAAMQATVNQNATAAQIASNTPAPDKAATVDLTGSGASDASDPRRKYNTGGASAGIGGNAGGVGIRLT